MSAHVERAPQWQAFAAPTSSVTVPGRTQEEAVKGRRFMRGWSSEERHFAIGSVLVAGGIPGVAGIVIALANHVFGSGITP